MNRALPWVSVVLAAVGCGARTDPGHGGADAALGVDADADADADARSDARPPSCCGSTLLNENETPLDNCVQGAAYLAFAVTPACDLPLGRIEVHTNALTLGLLASAGAGPGAVLVPPTTPQTPAPGWRSISPSGVTLLQGQRYWVIIGNDHKAPGVGCDYSDVGEDVEYWGGDLGNFDGPYYAPYVARLVSSCN